MIIDNTTDFSNQIGTWLRSSLKLAELVSDEARSELQELYEYWSLPSYSLAFVGKLSLGKSTLINRLLERDLLPAGILPRTATLTSIVNGSEDYMSVSFADGSRTTRPLEKSSWDDLLATNQQGEEQKVSAKVQLTLNHPWLKKIDVRLIDTPSVGDLNEQALLSTLLGQCDAIVLIVSATSPFRMTEAAFLRKEIIGRNITRIMVVVSKLDLFSQEERLNIFNNIRDRVRQISPKITVLAGHSVNTDTPEEEAFGEVRTKIEEFLAKENRRAWRSQKVAAQIINYLEQLVKTSHTNISAINMSLVQREQALQELRANISQANLQWNDIKIQLNNYRLEHDKKLQQVLNQEKSNLLRSCLLAMRQQENLKFWWEQSFPDYLHSQLVNLDQKLYDLILKNLTNDIQWLQTEVEQVFEIQLGKRNFELLDQAQILPEELDSQLTLTDINKYRLIWQNIDGSVTGVISGISGLFAGPILSMGAKEGAIIAITAGGALLAIPIVIFGIAVGEGVNFLVNKSLQNSIEEQQNLLAKALENTFEKAFQQYCSRISDNLRLAYDQLIEHTKQIQSNWSKEKVSIFQVKDHETNETFWQEVIAKVSDLKKEINETVREIN